MDIESFNPKNDKTGKMSPNLYAFLRKHKTKGYVQVYRDINGVLWIGKIHRDLEFTGCRLIDTLCNGASQQLHCYPKLHTELVKVPTFWDDYAKLGCCFIDPDHTMVFVSELSKPRWDVTPNGKIRTCKWCGQFTQFKDQYIFSEIRERWVNSVEEKI